VDFLGIDPVGDEELARRRAESEQYLTTHARWDMVEASFREDRGELDDELRNLALAALKVVRRELGDDWPARFFWSDARIASFLGNQASWTAKMLVVLAHSMETAAHAQGWHRVRRRLQKPLEADPALLELEAGVRAISRGLQVTFEPSGRGAKKADLLIREKAKVSPPLYAECTSIRAFPQSSDIAGRTSSILFPALRLLDMGLQAGGSLTRPVTEAELQELAILTSEFYGKCQASQRAGELVVDDLLYLWAIPTSHPDAVAFVAAHGGEMRFSVAFQHDPLIRLAATIQRKAARGQLPQEHHGLLLVEPSRTVWQLPLDAIRGAVRTAMAAMPFLSATALIHQHLGHEPSELIELSESDFAIVRSLYAPIQETVVLVRNPARRSRGADALVDGLFTLGSFAANRDDRL